MEDGQIDPGSKPEDGKHEIQQQHGPFVEEARVGCAIAAADLQRWIEEEIGHREETERRNCDHEDELVGADGVDSVPDVPVCYCGEVSVITRAGPGGRSEGPNVRSHTVTVDAQSGDGHDSLQGADWGIEVHHLVDVCSNARCAQQ